MAKWRTPFSLSTPVWTNLALPTSGAITNGYDTGGRLKGTWLKSGTGAIVNRHTYLYNTYGQPQRHTLADLSYTTYSYDDDAQLTSALGYTSGGVAVAAEQLGFVYDPGWNLTNRSVNGAGITYTVDDRNQLSSVGAVTYSYDAMGNLQTETGGDNRSYTYDNENRLIMVQWGASSYRTEFAYDALSRLRKRTERFLSGGVWTLIGETRYLYDGMQVVQERDGSNVPTVTYTRGKDLSGTLAGAGGIGGMLSRSHGYSAGSWSTHSYYHADGLGNITRLVNSTNGVVGSYKYDAYGRTISSSGALASANVYRFSSKMWIYDGTPGYYYFGYRFYQPSLQRWLNRDAVEERGGINLHAFCLNMPNAINDINGLWPDGGFPIDIKEAHTPVSTIHNNVSAFLHFLDGTGSPVTISGDLALDFQELQRLQNWPKMTESEELCTFDYFSLDEIDRWADVATASGSFRYTDDGTTTTISDYYAFPFTLSNGIFNVIFRVFAPYAAPFEVTGSWPSQN